MKDVIPEAKALTDSALLSLFEVLNSAANPEEFLSGADAILANPRNTLPLPVNLGTPHKLTTSGNRAIDLNNAPLVHEYLGEMDRANAADARLWGYLSLVTYREYMENRWPLNKKKGDSDSWKRRVKDRWLLPPGSATRGKLVRHGISRLWWVAHLTYGISKNHSAMDSDPYEYTREVFKSEDRLNAIFDREVGAFPTVISSVLSHAISLESKATDKYIQRIMQYLTLVNGYRDIGVLDSITVDDLVESASFRAN